MTKKLPFEKPSELIVLEPRINQLLVKYHLDKYYSVEDLELMIYECEPENEFTVFDPVLEHLNSAMDKADLMIVLNNELWNATPLKMMNGISPIQSLNFDRLKEKREVMD